MKYKDRTIGTTPPQRLDIKLGYACNNNCRFCVAADKKCLGDKSTMRIKEELETSRLNGAADVVFTGGEVTIRPDISELISYARHIGFRIISLQTNGRMFYYKAFCNTMINLGVTYFVISLHGHKPKIHDYLTRSCGSFKQTTSGIKNLREQDQKVITNSVITQQNYRFLPDIVRFLSDLDVNQFQLAFTHAEGNAYRNFDYIVPSKSDIMEYVHRALDIVIESGARAMIEAYPFCFMKGYEKYCLDVYTPPIEVRDIPGTIPDFELVRRYQAKAKGPRCSECKYDLICEGPWREYPEKFGWDEFKPVPGEKIRDLNEFKEIMGII